MQLDQILIRPGDAVVIIQYTDSAGRAGSKTFDLTSNTNAVKLVGDCKALMPPETADRPDAAEIQQEIGQLEERLVKLRNSIGQ